MKSAYPIIIGKETLAIFPLEGAATGVGAASVAAVAVVVVSTGASVAPTVVVGSVAAVVAFTAGTGRVARQVFTSVAVVSSLVQHASKMAAKAGKI